MIDKFRKGDIRRTLLVVAVIAEEQPITLNNLVEVTGMPKGTVQEQLKKLSAGQLPNLKLIKTGSAYSVESDVQVINLNNLKKWYKLLKVDC